MNTGFIIPEGDLPGLLDRLVCGELDEGARRRLLAWLEAEPLRWRLCGVAFLEAQTWSQAFGELPRGDYDLRRDTVHPAICTAAPRVSDRRHRTAVGPLGLAALLIAFGLGLALRDVVVPQGRQGERQGADLATSQSSSRLSSRTGDQAANAVGSETPSQAEPVLAAL